ncbi:substrate-binding periplasmic protein [Pseudoduganella sp. OTU4001]|uniref:substrate-binding periplasmic protein n=1 Tax=Pseudoduganella sp. OTU4001 TaxID=3043854 RepID=UPI00313D4E40
MRLAVALLFCLVFQSTPLHAEELQLSVIAQHSVNDRIWPALEAAAKRINITVVARPMSADRGVVEASMGQLDGAAGRSSGVEQKFPDLLRVPEPVYHYAPSAYSYMRPDVSRGWASLRSYSLCIRRGLQLTTARTRDMARQQLADEVSMLRMLKEGGCEVAIMDRNEPAAKAVMATDPGLAQLKPALEEMPLYIYLHKRHAALVPKLAAALKQLRADGTLNKLSGEGD